jgi:hypothetical protein
MRGEPPSRPRTCGLTLPPPPPCSAGPWARAPVRSSSHAHGSAASHPITRLMAAFNPSCASEMTSFTPRRPRRTILLRTLPRMSPPPTAQYADRRSRACPRYWRPRRLSPRRSRCGRPRAAGCRWRRAKGTASHRPLGLPRPESSRSSSEAQGRAGSYCPAAASGCATARCRAECRQVSAIPMTTRLPRPSTACSKPRWSIAVVQGAVLRPSSLLTLEWADWFNHRRILEPIGNVPSAEAEALYYARLEITRIAA